MQSQPIVRISLPADTLSSAVRVFLLQLLWNQVEFAVQQLWTQIYLESLAKKPQCEATSQVAFSFTGLVREWQQGRAGVFKQHELKTPQPSEGINRLLADENTKHNKQMSDNVFIPLLGILSCTVCVCVSIMHIWLCKIKKERGNTTPRPPLSRTSHRA